MGNGRAKPHAHLMRLRTLVLSDAVRCGEKIGVPHVVNRRERLHEPDEIGEIVGKENIMKVLNIFGRECQERTSRIDNVFPRYTEV